MAEPPLTISTRSVTGHLDLVGTEQVFTLVQPMTQYQLLSITSSQTTQTSSLFLYSMSASSLIWSQQISEVGGGG